MFTKLIGGEEEPSCKNVRSVSINPKSKGEKGLEVSSNLDRE